VTPFSARAKVPHSMHPIRSLKARHLTVRATMTMSRRLICTFLCTLLSSIPTTHAAHSRRRPTVVRREPEPRYDRSITTFSPDGRLQQVEYGLEASRRGDPVVAMMNHHQIYIAVHSSDKVHRIDDHILMVTAGLVGDGRMQASQLRIKCQQFRLVMGEAPTAKEVARMAADIQHSLTRTPGARPLGCTAILAGVEDGTTLRLFQTDSGGILEECLYCAAGKGQDKSMTSLQTLVEDVGSTFKEEQDAMDRIRMIQGVAEVALDALKDKDGPEHVDVWILQGEKGRRGGIYVRCVQKIRRKDLPLLKERLLSAMDGGASEE